MAKEEVVAVNGETLRKWARLARLSENMWDFALDEHGKKPKPWILRLRSGMRIEFRPHRGDCSAFRESWIQHDYLGGGLEIGRGGVVVDIGANIGAFSLWACEAVGPSGRVIAVEPASETCAQLRRNVDLNALEMATVVQAAVAGRTGEVTLTATDMALFSSIYDEVDGRSNVGESETVPCITLEQLFDDHGLDRVSFLKLDCEGAEYEIVETMSADLASRIDQIAMEIHEIDNRNADDLFTRLSEFGFDAVRDGPLAFFRRPSSP